MIDKYDPCILLLQETWLINSKLNILNNIHKNYLSNGVSAVKDTELLMGCPKGGLGILWKKSMVDCVTFTKIPNTDRACAIQIKCGNDYILCINM